MTTSPLQLMKRLPQFLALVSVLALTFSAGCASDTLHPVREEKRELTQVESQNNDFAFPSRPPQLSKGKVVFEKNCATCHAGGKNKLSYADVRKQKPIDSYLMLTRGDNKHPKFRDLTRDQRWEAIFYGRYIAGDGQYTTHSKAEIATIFGGNCAVCHGTKGQADGTLYSGHPSKAHELGVAPVKEAFYPPPANFHAYSRMYNRTNDTLVKHIVEGVYPTAMPSWEGRVDKDKGVKFDKALITDLVKYVRTFGYEDDLPEEVVSEAMKGAAKVGTDSSNVSAGNP